MLSFNWMRMLLIIYLRIISSILTCAYKKKFTGFYIITGSMTHKKLIKLYTCYAKF